MTAVENLVSPHSSGEFPIADPERFDDIERKHHRIADLLAAHELDALLIQKPSNFAWMTSGGNCLRSESGETTAALFVTADARVVVASNTDSGQIFDIELPGLGFQLKERPWYEPRSTLIEDLCRGRRVASDAGFPRTKDFSTELAKFRTPLSLFECERLRQVGKQVAHAVEATARSLEPGRSEAEIAGELAHRLIKHELIPVQLQVMGDGRGKRYPHWSFGKDPVRRWCVISAIGRRYGLCVAATRSVSFDAPDFDLQGHFQEASMLGATAMYFSKSDWELSTTFEKIRRMYEKFGHADEWRLADLGGVIGYEICEVPVVPKSDYRIRPGTPLYWRPSIGPALVGDTILVTHDGFEQICPSEVWPRMEIAVKDAPIHFPAMLQRYP